MRKSTKLISFAVATVIAASVAANAEAFKFGVMSDTQWKANLDGQNPSTVAVGIINQVNTQFINQGVKFVVQVGDLCDSEGSNNAGLQTRLGATSALTTAGISFYGLRGNHESSTGAQTFFKNNYIPSTNSERTVALAPDATSYSVNYNNTKIVLLDYALAGNTTALNIATPWMNSQLAADDHDVSFVFGHKSLVGRNHKDSMFGSGDESNPTQQNAFYSSLQANNAMYISGHDHMHDLSRINSPDGQSTVSQLICASDSYKFYTPVSTLTSRYTNIQNELYSVGYYIFTVDGEMVTVDFYHADPNPATPGLEDLDLTVTPNLTFSKASTWNYQGNPVPEPSSVLTMLSGVVGLAGLATRRKR